jgi:hypothetical protein
MSITKHISTILTEQISEKKRQALFNLFLKKYSLYNDYFQLNDITEYAKKHVYTIFNMILQIDPTPNNQYTQWLILKGIPSKYNIYGNSRDKASINGHQLKQDIEDIKYLLQTHFNKKQSKDFPQEYKDINKIESISDLREVVKKYLPTINDTIEESIVKAELIEGKDYTLLADDSSASVYIPLNERSACILGSSTSWCTTWGEYSVNPDFKDRENHFTYHNDKGNLYIVNIKSNNELFQLHFPTNQIKDRNDDDVTMNKAFYGASDYIKNTFADYVFENDMSNYNMDKIEFSSFEYFLGEFLPEVESEFVRVVDYDFVDYTFEIPPSVNIKIKTDEYNQWNEEEMTLIRSAIKKNFHKKEFVLGGITKNIDSISDKQLLNFIYNTNELMRIRDVMADVVVGLLYESYRPKLFREIIFTVYKNSGLSPEVSFKEFGKSFSIDYYGSVIIDFEKLMEGNKDNSYLILQKYNEFTKSYRSKIEMYGVILPSNPFEIYWDNLRKTGTIKKVLLNTFSEYFIHY